MKKLSIDIIRLKLEGKNILALYIDDNHNITLNDDLIKRLKHLEEGEITNIKDNQNNNWEISCDEFKGFTFFNVNNPSFFSLKLDDIKQTIN